MGVAHLRLHPARGGTCLHVPSLPAILHQLPGHLLGTGFSLNQTSTLLTFGFKGLFIGHFSFNSGRPSEIEESFPPNQNT